MRWHLPVMLLLLLLLPGCGKKGALVPPEALVPASIGDLRVSQKGNAFLLSWTKPAVTEGGSPLHGLTGFRVLRREVLPPDQDCEQCPTAYRLLKSIDLEYLQGATRVGDRFFLLDDDLAEGKTYQYKALSSVADGSTSRDSNKPLRRKVTPPPAPALALSTLPGGVELSWELAPLPQGVLLAGYNVYRRSGGDPFRPIPVNDRPLQTFRFQDHRLQAGVSYTYVVTVVVESQGQLTESASSNDVTARLPLPE